MRFRTSGVAVAVKALTHARPQRLHQLVQAQVGWPEAVAPLADAVRFIHHQVLDGAGSRQRRQQPVGNGRFRGDEHQPYVTAGHPLQDGAAFGPALPAAQHRHRQPGRGHAAVQILQQRKQWHHHQGDPLQHQRREHEAHRLAGAGRQHHDLVAPLEQVGDDQALVGKQVGDAQLALRQGIEGIGDDLGPGCLAPYVLDDGAGSAPLRWTPPCGVRAGLRRGRIVPPMSLWRG